LIAVEKKARFFNLMRWGGAAAIAGMAPSEGDYIWQGAGQTRAVKNPGTAVIEFVEFELK
jgi:hypothetical protein